MQSSTDSVDNTEAINRLEEYEAEKLIVRAPRGMNKLLACPPIDMTGINGPAHLSELCSEQWEAGLCCSGLVD